MTEYISPETGARDTTEANIYRKFRTGRYTYGEIAYMFGLTIDAVYDIIKEGQARDAERGI